MNHLRLKWTLTVLSVLLCTAVVFVFLRSNDFSIYGKYSIEDDPRFNRSVEPFLSADYRLSVEAFNWWKKIQSEPGNMDVFSKTMDKLFEMFPRNPDIANPKPDGGRICAVVGNSANLKGSNYGPLIDAHDVIIRINHARTEGYEADVGQKTTHHVMYPESAVDLDDNTRLVLIPFKIKDLEWLVGATTTGFHYRSYAVMKPHVKVNKDLVMVVNPAFMRYVHLSWLKGVGAYPSSGFMTTILALHFCDEVHVFGFGADQDGNWSHYWEQLRDKNFKTGIHPGIQEYYIIKELDRHQRLQFFKGR